MEIKIGGKSKSNLTSKTLWGFGALIAIVYLKAHGYAEASPLIDALEAIAGIVGLAGARDAMRKG